MNNSFSSKLRKITPPKWGYLYLALGLMVQFFLPIKTLSYPLLKILGSVIFVAGFSVMMWAWSLFQKEKTEVCPTSAVNQKFIARGPYRISRNPMYLGMMFMLLGVAIFLGSIPVLAASIAYFMTINYAFVPFEEQKMNRQYGQNFADYLGDVGRWL